MSNVRWQQRRHFANFEAKGYRSMSVAPSLGAGRRHRGRAPPFAALFASLGVGCPSRFAGGQRTVVLIAPSLVQPCGAPDRRSPHFVCSFRLQASAKQPKEYSLRPSRKWPRGILPLGAGQAQCVEPAVAAECSRPSALRRPVDNAKTMPIHMNRPRPITKVVLRKQERHVNTPPPNPSIEGTASGLRPSAAPHVNR